MSACEGSASASEFSDCMAAHDGQETSYAGLNPKDRSFCKAHVSTGDFKTPAECVWAAKHPAEYLCPNTQAKDAHEKCLWALKHPVEAACEKDPHGSYWDCVRTGQEHQDRQQAIRVQEQIRRDNAIQQQTPQKTTCTTHKDFVGNLVTECE